MFPVNSYIVCSLKVGSDMKSLTCHDNDVVLFTCDILIIIKVYFSYHYPQHCQVYHGHD